jgi:hypothetical protein
MSSNLKLTLSLSIYYQGTISRVDSVAIPVALMVLAFRVRSPPLLLIPVLSLLVSLCFSLAVLDVVALTLR